MLFLRVLAIASFATAFAAVSSGSGASAQQGARPVVLEFAARTGDQPVACGSVARVGLGEGVDAGLRDLRFYIHEIQMIPRRGAPVIVTLEQDGVWQHKSVAMVDLETRAGPCANGTRVERTQVVGRAPAGDYVGVRFRLGVPFELNHADATKAPPPLNLTAMFWSWRMGYKFLRLDLATGVSGSATPAGGYSLHVGSVGCVREGASPADQVSPATRCASPNVAEVVLFGRDPRRSVVVFDLRALLSETDLSPTGSSAHSGCLGDPASPACVGAFRALGLLPGVNGVRQQSVFRLEARS